MRDDQMNIVLLGGPGSGKGTLAKQLCSKFGYVVLSPGELYRREANLGTEFGLRAKAYWDDGNLCPDEMTNELVRSEVEKLGESSIIFDGYPRTIVQAKYLDSICKIHLILDLYVGDDTVTRRLLKRASIENRPDDTEDVIKTRLKVYHNNIYDIVDYYELTPHRYNSFYAGGSIEETFDLAASIIGDRY
jgi:adenylate kinase